ncbi:MAG TPA: hypothetical protein VNS49_01435 [Streptomyces sp.]|nr:hypothetical protein [Streptomyces sp.]
MSEGQTVPAATGGTARPVLLGAAGLHMVTQTALAPFYPALFRSAYGIRDLAATGLFLMLCQLAAVIVLPLWGRATRHVPLARLVTAGQAAAVLLAGALSLAPSYLVFTLLSVALIMAKSVVLLAYPAVARSHPKGLLCGVVQYVAVLHVAAVGATVLGTVVVAVPDPRAALPLLAVAEAVLLGACVMLLRVRREPAFSRPSAAQEPVAAHEPVAAQEPVAASRPSRALVRLAVFVLVNFVAVTAVRPYFTEYAAEGGASITSASLLFVLPHLAVLAVLPATRTLRRRFGGRLLPMALALAAAGLLEQAVTTEAVPLAIGRLLFGAGLGLAQVAFDERVLTITGSGAAYSLVAAAQTCGLLLAPLLATATASAALAGPLLAGAALLAVLAVLVRGDAPPAPTQETASPTMFKAVVPAAADRRQASAPAAR